jgi:hypothetical protein
MPALNHRSGIRHTFVASELCLNLQNNFAACAPTLGKLVCPFYFCER